MYFTTKNRTKDGHSLVVLRRKVEMIRVRSERYWFAGPQAPEGLFSWPP